MNPKKSTHISLIVIIGAIAVLTQLAYYISIQSRTLNEIKESTNNQVVTINNKLDLFSSQFDLNLLELKDSHQQLRQKLENIYLQLEDIHLQLENTNGQVDPSKLPKRPMDEEYIYIHYDDEPGITKQKRSLIAMIVLASAMNRTIIYPVLKKSAGMFAAKLQFGDVFDESFFRQSLYGLVKFAFKEQVIDFDSHLNISISSPLSCSSTLAEIKENYSKNKIIFWVGDSDCDFREGHTATQFRHIFQGVIQAFRLIPEFRSKVDEILAKVKAYKGDGIIRPFVCLHARVENDFGVLGPEANTDIGTIVKRMAGHTFEVRGDKIEGIYVATGLTGDQVTNLFKDQFPYVMHKDTFLPDSDPLRHTESDVDTFKALLDFEICQKATFFIGNTYSIWSEMIHDLLRIPLSEQEWPNRIFTYTCMGDCTIKPFCSANSNRNFGYDCNREPNSRL